MGRRLYVENLSASTTLADLRSAFEPHGRIESMMILTMMEAGGRKRFASVEMARSRDAHQALFALDGSVLGGENIQVKDPHPEILIPSPRGH